MRVTERDTREKAIPRDAVGFNARAIAAAWEAAEHTPVCVAVALTNEFTDHHVTAADGTEEDRDVIFSEAGVHFEEKGVGVCDRETAEKYAPGYVELDRRDGRVLAVNPAQVFDYNPPEA